MKPGDKYVSKTDGRIVIIDYVGDSIVVYRYIDNLEQYSGRRRVLEKYFEPKPMEMRVHILQSDDGEFCSQIDTGFSTGFPPSFKLVKTIEVEIPNG